MTDEDDDDERTAPILQVVDFNALHAALGDAPSPLPPPPAPSPPAPPSAPAAISESKGRPNATYASRPRPIPQTRAPALDPNTPAVIIQTEDTAPTGPPIQMTVPMLGAPPLGSRGAPGAAKARPTVDDRAPTNVIPRKRPLRVRSPTLIVRPRGPTTLQKVVVFLAMLFVFVAGGIAFLLYGAGGLDPDPSPAAAPPVPVAPAAPAAPAKKP